MRFQNVCKLQNRLTTLCSLKKWNIKVWIKWHLESIWLMCCHILTYVLVKQRDDDHHMLCVAVTINGLVVDYYIICRPFW